MGGQIRVVIADDHRLFREGLRLMLARDEHIEIVGEAADGLQTIHLVEDLRPDVVLLDIKIPTMNGIEVIPSIRQESPKTKPLMLTGSRDEAMIFKALKAGAKGYLLKDASVSDLLKAIQTVNQGEMWVERKLITRFFDRDSQWEDEEARANKKLTSREQEVLRSLAQGLTNKEIAQALFISEKTVKSHLNSIFRKLNVTRRLQAILYAIHQGVK